MLLSALLQQPTLCCAHVIIVFRYSRSQGSVAADKLFCIYLIWCESSRNTSLFSNWHVKSVSVSCSRLNLMLSGEWHLVNPDGAPSQCVSEWCGQEERDSSTTMDNSTDSGYNKPSLCVCVEFCHASLFFSLVWVQHQFNMFMDEMLMCVWVCVCVIQLSNCVHIGPLPLTAMVLV